MSTDIKVTSQQLRQLLHRIVDQRLKTCVRFRLIGKMWETNFMRVMQVTERGVALTSENDNILVVINDLNDVMQFEFDQHLYQYEPHFHYYLQPMPYDDSN